MFHIPEHYHNFSLKLSEVLNNIGVNETMVKRSRKVILLLEAMTTASLIGSSISSVYHFGSLSEGTTTIGLNSDQDNLMCINNMLIINDISEWQPGLINLLMVKDDSTPPGYCQLQLLRSDTRLHHVHVENQHCVKVSSDKVLLKNTFLKQCFKEEHGPSDVLLGAPGERDYDFVPAIPFLSWPKEARQWFHRKCKNIWPTQEMKSYSQKSECFTVPIGSKISHNEALEWRISTSFAERCLMFSLNITQIRCYILMKMILKTYLNSRISSFMCKTVLLHCIEKTQSHLWIDSNLMKCLLHCLQRLYTSVIEGNCPHFIIPGNNLMAGRFPLQDQNELQKELSHVIQSNGHALFGIQVDELGRRLQIKLHIIDHSLHTSCLSNFENVKVIQTCQLLNLSLNIIGVHYSTLVKYSNYRLVFKKHLQRCKALYRNGNKLQKTAVSLLTAQICLSLGTIKASLNLHTNGIVSSQAIDLLNIGLNSDVSSGRLKLASVFYCMGDMLRTEVILRETERKYDRQAVEPVSSPWNSNHPIYTTVKRQFAEEIYNKDILCSIRENIAFCVTFIPAEINCVPHELQYEMFRSNKDDVFQRDNEADFWMDWAVVDSLPYLYFLQYKTYCQLQRRADQQQALYNLTDSLQRESNLCHRETAFNLLGQCLENENRIQEALQCYVSSLSIRDRKNAARIHICNLLAALVNKALY